jgi:hypothetical protein
MFFEACLGKLKGIRFRSTGKKRNIGKKVRKEGNK